MFGLATRSVRVHELALFAGGGGGILGSLLAGWRTVCAVEINARCRAGLMARQRDGLLEPFPIWDDVRTFDGRPWRGRVDLVSGGFPCQAFSTASHGRRVAPDLWPAMAAVVRDVQPRRVLAENVQRAPIERAALELQGLGYHCLVVRAPASAVGAPHRRVRWWLAADAHGHRQSVLAIHGQVAELPTPPSPLWDEHPRAALGVDDGMAVGLDINGHAAGNGQVPQVVHALARWLGWAT